MNTFGENWTFTSFGESHGAAIGGVLDGVPAGLHIDMSLIRQELERRAGKGMAGFPCQKSAGIVNDRIFRQELLHGSIDISIARRQIQPVIDK